MKKRLLWMCVCVIAMGTIAIAAEEVKTVTPKGPVAPALERPAGSDGMRVPMSRENVYKQMLAHRMETHKAEIAKLEAIVKIAEEEKATKTVEALKALIAEKDKEFQNQIQKADQHRQGGARRPTPGMNTTAAEPQAQPETPKPAAKPEKKK
jgi:hypothetical protein